MSQWGNQDEANNSVKWGAESINAGSGKANIAANNTSLFNNTTPQAFPSSGAEVIGQFGVTAAAMANTTGESGKVGAIGWVLRRAGMGPVLRFTIANSGSNYANGSSFVFTGGTGAVNGAGYILANSQGNVTGVVVTSGGKFPNVTYITVGSPANGVLSFGITNTGLGYTTGDIATVSNGVANATATIVANAAANGSIVSFTLTNAGRGFVSNADSVISILAANGAATGNGVLSATASSNRGNGYSSTDTVLFSNGTVNATGTFTVGASGNISAITITSVGSGFANTTDTNITVLAANGAASNGSGATIVATILGFVGNVDIGAGASANLIPVLGGRAGRVAYETLVATKTINTNTGSNTVIFPQ
jgi:hypothetical protein